jgi:hypothetical protein
MALLGGAALAMRRDVAPDIRTDFEHRHTHGHLPSGSHFPDSCVHPAGSTPQEVIGSSCCPSSGPTRGSLLG